MSSYRATHVKETSQTPSMKAPVVDMTFNNRVEHDEILHKVYMGPPTRTKIIFYQVKKDLYFGLSKKLVDRGYVCEELFSPEATLPLLQNPLYQVVLVFCVQDTLHASIQTLLRQIQSHGLSDSVVVMAIVPNTIQLSHSVFTSLLSGGVSRIFYEGGGEEKFLQELRLAEMNELKLNKLLQFSRALKKAIDNSHDAIQVTRDGTVMYINKSFSELTGYFPSDCLGKKAEDIMTLQDNGIRNIVNKTDPYEGHIVGRRKSGSCTKQYVKLLPVLHPAGHVSHHITIQRLLSTQEVGSSSTKTVNNGTTESVPLKPSGIRTSLPRVSPLTETPLLRALHLIDFARENQLCPVEIKESLDKCMDILRTAELFTPPVPSKGLVAGLLDTGRFPHTSGVINSEDIGSPILPVHPHTHHTFKNSPPQAVQECLCLCSSWDFNIIHLEASSHFQPLYYVGMKVFEEFSVCETLMTADMTIASWLKLMEKNYKHRNTYHNSTHAADVLQGTAYLIRSIQNTTLTNSPLQPIEIAALLITAVIHDLDHPGRTNPFLVNSANELALLYNDRACLENHHVATSFKLTLQHKDHNIFQHLDNAVYRSVRSTIIDLVLATDMAKHFEHLSKFENFSAKEGADLLCIDNRLLIQRTLVKCADISNACRPLELCKEWAARIAEEYFSQTKEEKERKLHVVFPDFERQTCNLPGTQVKFIDFFVSGLFEAWNRFTPIPQLMENLNFNYEHWKLLCGSSPNSLDAETEDQS